MVDNEKEYLLRFPTFEDVKFLNDDNPVETDISDDESIHKEILLKCNGWSKLNPTGRNVYRLLKTYNNSIWTPQTVIRPEGYEDFLLRTRSPQDLAKIKKAQEGPSASSSSFRDEGPSTSKMSSHKSGKRKREESEDDEHHHKKIAKTSNTNKPNHTLSSDSSVDSSDDELDCDELGNSINKVNVQESDSVNDTETVNNNENRRTDKSSHSSVNIEISDSEIEEGDIQFLQHVGNSHDPTSHSQTQGNSSTPEKDFQEHNFTHKDEEEISKFSSLLGSDLVENNNMWILQCPISMDCSHLAGQQLNLTDSSKLYVGNRSYESFSFKSKDNRVATLAVPREKNQLQLMRIPIDGNIIVEEYVDLTSDSGFSITEAPRFVEMPDNLKTRHPLFGKNYKKQIKMAKKIELISIKKEPEDLLSEEEAVEESSLHSNFIDNPTPSKKNKKRKDKSSETYISESDISSYNSPKKKKKRKKEHE